MARALLYSQLCGANSKNISEIEFIAGCNRFALDNPTPTITSRLAFYGNDESIEKKLRVFAEKMAIAPEMFDPKVYGSQYPGGKPERALDGSFVKKRHDVTMRDMQETLLPEEKKQLNRKMAAVTDVKLLNEKFDQEKMTSPAEAVVAQGMTIRIKDIPTKKENKQFKLTNMQVSMSGNKAIVIPSFGTTGALFARHFDILSKLRKRILLLEIAFHQQQDPKRCWDQTKQIIKVLNEGCRFLSLDEQTGEAKAQEFYEDPTLDKDEADITEMLQRKLAMVKLQRTRTMRVTKNRAGRTNTLLDTKAEATEQSVRMSKDEGSVPMSR